MGHEPREIRPLIYALPMQPIVQVSRKLYSLFSKIINYELWFLLKVPLL